MAYILAEKKYVSSESIKAHGAEGQHKLEIILI